MTDDFIEVVGYDPQWPRRYREETEALRKALGRRIDRIEHVGSTGVPGTAAKPTIDILVGVKKLNVDETVTSKMKALGYRYFGEYGIPGRYFFRKGSPPTHHVHWVKTEGEFWRRQLLFRNYLREHPRELRRYEKLKRGLARKFRTDRSSYTESKTEFVEDALERARVWRKAGRGTIIVVDLEATCWKERTDPARMEIIEIGAVRLGKNLSPKGEFSSFVRPVHQPRLSAFCRKLTSIRQEDVDQAESFREVFAQFLKWIGTGRVTIASWSRYDLRQFLTDCERHGIVPPPSLERHIDLQGLFAEQNGTDPAPMAAALGLAGLKLTGTHHRGIDDARNIAKLAKKMLR